MQLVDYGTELLTLSRSINKSLKSEEKMLEKMENSQDQNIKDIRSANSRLDKLLQ